MRKIKLFQVAADVREPLFIAAKTTNHAAEIYITLKVAAGREVSQFSVERVDDKLPAELQTGLSDMLTHGATGIAVVAPLFGWCVAQPV